MRYQCIWTYIHTQPHTSIQTFSKNSVLRFHICQTTFLTYFLKNFFFHYYKASSRRRKNIQKFTKPNINFLNNKYLEFRISIFTGKSCLQIFYLSKFNYLVLIFNCWRGILHFPISKCWGWEMVAIFAIAAHLAHAYKLCRWRLWFYIYHCLCTYMYTCLCIIHSICISK